MKTVSEWVKAGHFESGLFLIARPVIEIREKAISIRLPKYNKGGDLITATAWFPKSKVKFVTNDYYADGMGEEMMLIPAWLIEAKEKDGFVFGL